MHCSLCLPPYRPPARSTASFGAYDWSKTSWSATAQPSGTVIPMSAVTATRSAAAGPAGELVGNAGPPVTAYAYVTPAYKGRITAVKVQPRRQNIPAEYGMGFAPAGHQLTFGSEAAGAKPTSLSWRPRLGPGIGAAAGGVSLAETPREASAATTTDAMRDSAETAAWTVACCRRS